VVKTNPATVLTSDAAARRLLGAGVDAVAEFDQQGKRLAYTGQLSNPITWLYMNQFGAHGRSVAAGVAERLTSVVIGDTFMIVMGVAGGGTIVAAAERVIVGRASDQIARALDNAVSKELGASVGPWAVLAAVCIVAGIILSESRGSS
jgi:hypothetical protein